METHPGIKLTVKVVALTVVFALTLALLASLPEQPVSPSKLPAYYMLRRMAFLRTMPNYGAWSDDSAGGRLASVGDTIYTSNLVWILPHPMKPIRE